MSRTLARVTVSLTLEGEALKEAGFSLAGGVYSVSSALANKLREMYPTAKLLITFEEYEDSIVKNTITETPSSFRKEAASIDDL